jgi:hypothetical protein
VTQFDPNALLDVLHRHDVRYVLIGGLAAALRGSAAPTFDVDITPDTDATNLARLSAALTDLDARVRVDGIPDGLPFSHDAASLAQMTTLNLTTRLGDLDVAFYPAGVGDYSQWEVKSASVTVLGVPVKVASLDDIIRSKEAADRNKDRLQLPMLRALQQRQHRPDKPPDST